MQRLEEECLELSIRDYKVKDVYVNRFGKGEEGWVYFDKG